VVYYYVRGGGRSGPQLPPGLSCSSTVKNRRMCALPIVVVIVVIEVWERRELL